MNAQLPTVLFDGLRNWALRRLERHAARYVLQPGSGADERALRVLAELGDDELSDLSETGQRLRREARRSLHAHSARSRNGVPAARGPAG
jgi:hypothetical protein